MAATRFTDQIKMVHLSTPIGDNFAMRFFGGMMSGKSYMTSTEHLDNPFVSAKMSDKTGFDKVWIDEFTQFYQISEKLAGLKTPPDTKLAGMMRQHSLAKVRHDKVMMSMLEKQMWALTLSKLK